MIERIILLYYYYIYGQPIILILMVIFIYLSLLYTYYMPIPIINCYLLFGCEPSKDGGEVFVSIINY